MEPSVRIALPSAEPLLDTQKKDGRLPFLPGMPRCLLLCAPLSRVAVARAGLSALGGVMGRHVLSLGRRAPLRQHAHPPRGRVETAQLRCAGRVQLPLPHAGRACVSCGVDVSLRPQGRRGAYPARGPHGQWRSSIGCNARRVAITWMCWGRACGRWRSWPCGGALCGT